MLGVSTAPPAGLPSLNLRQNLDWAERETVRRALEQLGRRQEGRRGGDGHQPARAQLLPRQAPGRIDALAAPAVRHPLVSKPRESPVKLAVNEAALTAYARVTAYAAGNLRPLSPRFC